MTDGYSLDWAPTTMRPLIRAAIATAATTPGIVGLTVGGSAATGAMDRFSDLDFVVICRDDMQAHLLRQAPDVAARLGPLLTAFTGEHVGEPRLVICLYGPPVLHVDLKFMAERDLANRYEDGRILWQRDGAVSRAYRSPVADGDTVPVQWIEDRFWTWVHYGATKIGRGEYFECLDHLAFLRRAVLGPLISKQRGHPPNGVRRLERLAPELVGSLTTTIGDHSATGCLAAMRETVALYRELRAPHSGVRRHEAAERAVTAFLDEIAGETPPRHADSSR